MKKTAKGVLKEHYGIFVILCLIAAILGVEFTSSISVIQSKAEIEQTGKRAEVGLADSASTAITDKFVEIMGEMAAGNEADARKQADEEIASEVERSNENTKAVAGRSRGVLSVVVNQVTSGSVFISMVVAVRSVVGSNNLAVGLLIIGSLLAFLFVCIFVMSAYLVIMRRMFMEGMRYEKVHTNRVLFLLKVKKWFHAGFTVFLTGIYYGLWALTIVGAFVKRYSYYMVPYIVAENPGIKSNDAITLSRQMMNGHKWECFVYELSFILWKLLGVCTLGLSNIFFTNPYMVAVFSEYYCELRRLAKQKGIKNADLLNDKYLFEKPDVQTLQNAYADVADTDKNAMKKWGELTGFRKVFASTFGVMLGNGPKEKAFEAYQSKRIRLFYAKEALDGNVYPTRLSAIPVEEKRTWVAALNYTRCYSIWSVVMMFFVMSFVGWLWEVSLHLITDGEFVNRGVLHGPWLPIYGSGSVLILLVLNKLRRNPGLEFISAVVLCGCVEYFTAYYLEMTHNGTKWWDYSGYFLNLHGRICAEGLLVFGLGGMAIVYVLAPVLDSVFRRIPYKVLMITGVVLLVIFAADELYSSKYPNVGDGITSAAKAHEILIGQNLQEV